MTSPVKDFPAVVYRLTLIGLFSLFVFISWELGLKKTYWDYRVEQLCRAQSPLVKRVEKVPIGLTDRERNDFFAKNLSKGEKTLYREQDVRRVIQESQPLVYELTTTYSRNKTGKVIGVIKNFYRVGGGFWLTGDNQSFSCVDIPDLAAQYAEQLFVAGAVSEPGALP